MPRAAVMTAPGAPIEVQERVAGPLERGAVRLQTIYSEVCGTDVHLHHGRLSGVPYPLVPGHVSVGRVVEVADSVFDIDGKPVVDGDVVTFLDVHETCHQCWMCLVARASTRCPHRKVYGITYGADDGLLGGWCEQIDLKPGVLILPLPPAVTPERLIAAGCGLPTAIHAIERAEVGLGDTVAVQGAGPVGLNAAALARLRGAGRVIVIGDPQDRLNAALAMGADDTIPLTGTTADERVEAVRERTAGRGADITIEATGSPAAVREGMRMTRDAGRYVVAGQYTDVGDVTFNPHADLNRKHLEIRATWGSDASHFYRMVQVLARYPELPWETLVTRHYGLDEMNEALEDVASGQVVKAVVDPARKESP